MSTILVDNFELNLQKPIDNRFVVGPGQFYVNKNSIPYKYAGLRVYDLNDSTFYYWTGASFSAEFQGGTGDVVSGGSGIFSYLPRFTGTNTISISQVFDNTFNVGFGTTVFGPERYIFGSGDLKIEGFVNADGPYYSYGLNSGYYVARRDNNSLDWTIFSNSGELRFQSSTATASVVIGSLGPYSINGSSTLFPNINPRMEIITGNSYNDYQEYVTLRHPAINSNAVIRSIGLIMKLSDEGSVGESEKMGGILVESSNSWANQPTLHLVTKNQRRLSVDASGDLKILTDYLGFMTNPGVYIGSAQGSQPILPQLPQTNTTIVLKSITVPSLCNIVVEATFLGRAYVGITATYNSNKIVSTYNVNSAGTVTLVGTDTLHSAGYAFSTMSGTWEVFDGQITTSTNTITLSIDATTPSITTFDASVEYKITIVN